MDDSEPPPPPPGFIPADQLLAGLERRPLYKRTDEKTAPSDNLANVIVYLSTLYSQLKADEQRPAPSASPVENGQKLLQTKRLSRSGASLEQGVVEFGQRSDAGKFTKAAPDERADAGDAGADDRLVARPIRSPQRQGVGLAVVCALLLAGLGIMTTLFLRERGWMVDSRGVSAERVPSVNRSEDGTITDEALGFSNLALDAVGRGELQKASDLLEEARTRQLNLPGMCYQGALLALSQRDEEKMDLWTDRALAANEAVPECFYLRANSEAFKGDFKAAVGSMETAARNAPFSPRYLFFWAECLRRQGTPRLALARFKQALRCRPSLADTELILFKMGLARIETGDDPDIQADLASRLAQEPVSGDTLLLAAANEINRNAFPAAAEFLQRAGRALPLPALRPRLRDYIFRTQAEQKDIAPVWNGLMSATAAHAPAPPGRKTIVDPATRGLPEADPAAW